MNDSVHTVFALRLSVFLQLFPVQESIHHAEEDEGCRQGCCPDGPVKECADKEECQADNDGRQVQLVRTGSLVIGIVDFADHEKGQDEHADNSQPVPDLGTGKDIGCHDDTGHWAGKSFEITVNAGDFYIKSGQSKGTECTKQGAGNESEGAHFMKLVGVHEGPSSDAKGNIIGKGIQFYSHGTSGMQGPGYTAVQGVCHHGNQNEHSSGFKISGYGHHDRQPAKKCICRGHCICYP